jgi:type IV pilus assembly protein PilO
MIRQNPSKWRERLHSAVSWHIAGLTILAVLIVGTTAKLCLDWAAAHGSSVKSLDESSRQFQELNLMTGPLRGLETRVAQSRGQVQAFYGKRIPLNYSSIAIELGQLGVKSGVRIARVQYSQGLPGADLTEIAMDAGISGEYSQIMHFVNGLERDQTFFVIRTMALTGQQGGTVNLRIRVSSWLRAADAASSGLPLTSEANQATPASSAFGKGGE